MISAVSERYQYDELNQLIREDSQSQGKTFIYSYDIGGNLTGVKEYEYTTGEVSGNPIYTSTGAYQSPDSDTSGEVWQDQLVSWTDGATGNVYTMTYDPVGNMLSKGSRTFEWKLGRKLAKVTDGTTISEYEYDHTGNRVKKTVTTGTETPVETTYRMAGDLLLSEKTGSQTIWYEYDSNASLISMKTGGKRYFYIKNAQNDIVGLTDADGNVVVRYQYDAWGNCEEPTGSLAATIGKKNPFRYRGYYYDTETGMYYLKSRFYDPGIRRFVSSDEVTTLKNSVETMHNKNLYIYCDGNPIDRKDSAGELWGIAVGALVGAFVSMGKQQVIDGKSFEEINWIDVGMTAISFAVSTTALGRGVQMAVNAATSCISSWSNGDNMGKH